MVDHLLSTIDNPFNPFTEWTEWYSYDRRMGYDTLGLLARVARVSSDLSPSVYRSTVEQAILDIMEVNPNGLYTVIADPSSVSSGSITNDDVVAGLVDSG